MLNFSNLDINDANREYSRNDIMRKDNFRAFSVLQTKSQTNNRGRRLLNSVMSLSIEGRRTVLSPAIIIMAK
jgi:hypothetical protein